MSGLGGASRGGVPASRVVTRIAPAPCTFGAAGKCLSACIDTLGRVLLVDAETSAVLRIWKGYRYAQVAWTAAAARNSATDNGEDDGGSGAGVALLVVYAPLKRRVEVWEPFGARRAVFAVDDDKAGAPVLASNTADGEGGSRFCLAAANAPVAFSMTSDGIDGRDRDRDEPLPDTARVNAAAFLIDCTRFNVDAIEGTAVREVSFGPR